MGNREEFQLGSYQFSASNIITHLEVPAIGPYSSLWDVMHADKLEVQRPYAMVLSDGKCSKGSIEGPSGAGYFGLVYEELAIVQPDPRHLQTTKMELEYNLGNEIWRLWTHWGLAKISACLMLTHWSLVMRLMPCGEIDLGQYCIR